MSKAEKVRDMAHTLLPGTADQVEVREVSAAEGREILDQAARRYLKMSGEEFHRRYESGELMNGVEHPEVMRVAMLLPFAYPGEGNGR